MSEDGYKIGHIYRIKASFNHEPVGVLAFVYRKESQGIYLISENGVDMGLFSPKDQSKYLEYVTDSGFIYVYENDLKLKEDIHNSLFEMAFS